MGKLAMTMMTMTRDATFAAPLTSAATGQDNRWRGVIAWMLKERLLPWVYWKAMLRGRELLATPELVA